MHNLNLALWLGLAYCKAVVVSVTLFVLFNLALEVGYHTVDL
jgi:hypothetical protein